VQQRNTIVNIPLLACLALSAILHVGILCAKGIYTPPKPLAQPGRTVVRLTLMPTIASRAIAELPTPSPEIPEAKVEEPVEQASRPALPAEPAVKPLPESKPEPLTETAPANSIEQEASLIREKGVFSEAQTAQSVSPVYPRISRRRGEEGTVTLSIKVLANGTAAEVTVLQSSGHTRLDKAALEAAQKTLFTPAQRLGRNVDSSTELSFTFRLTDD